MYSGSKKQSVNITPSPGTDNTVDVYKMIDSNGLSSTSPQLVKQEKFYKKDQGIQFLLNILIKSNTTFQKELEIRFVPPLMVQM